MTNATMSPLQQKIYFAARNAKDGVIFLDVIKSWNLSDEKTLSVALSHMVKKGWLMRLRNGVFLISEPNARTIINPFVISTYIYPGINAFSSALYIHKLTDMVPFEILVATRNESGTKRIGEYSFRAIPIKDKYGGSSEKGGVLVSSVAKTLYDCIMHPELSGGFPQILKALYESNLSKKDWDEFLSYAEKFERNSFFQRLGYLLSLFPKKNKMISMIIQKCKEKVGSKIYLYKRKKGKLIQEWMVIDDVGKEELLSWWY